MLAPHEVESLTTPNRCVGNSTLGPVYALKIKRDTYQRAQELTVLGELRGILWYALGDSGAHVDLLTTRPDWFIELERKLQDARPR